MNRMFTGWDNAIQWLYNYNRRSDSTLTTAIYHQSAGIADGINARSVDVMMRRQNSERPSQIQKCVPPYFGWSFAKCRISITVRVRVRVSSRVRVKIKFKVRVSIMARISIRTCGVTNVFWIWERHSEYGRWGHDTGWDKSCVSFTALTLLLG